MLRWLWSWAWSVGWYVLLLSGWVCWFTAHQRAERLRHELTVMSHSWRYTARQKDHTHG